VEVTLPETVDGLNVAPAPAGNPLIVSATLPENPLSAEIVTL
jgi:hypothetical protein